LRIPNNPTPPIVALHNPLTDLHLRFFDVDVRIRADSVVYGDFFEQLYHRFVVDGSTSLVNRMLDLIVITDPHNEWGRPLLVVDGVVWPLPSTELLKDYVYRYFFLAIMANIQSHILVHAGVVSWQGQGILLIGDSGHGKTTLVLELVRRGFHFLSDEIAAISRADALVYPFARNLRVRPNTLNLVGYPNLENPASLWDGKFTLDIEQFRSQSLGKAVPIRHIFYLEDKASKSHGPDEAIALPMQITMSHLTNELHQAIRNLDEVVSVDLVGDASPAVLHILTRNQTVSLAQIETLCEQHQVLILHIRRRPEYGADFSTEASVEAITLSQSVLGMLRSFQGTHRSVILREEFAGDATRLFLELAHLLRGTSSSRLYVGSLASMADLVCTAVDSGEDALEVNYRGHIL
jgi:hypothetical protein